MKRQHILWMFFCASLAVYLGAYGFFLAGGSGNHILETISGDPSVLEPYEIAFSLADSQVSQRFTLRSGKVSHKDVYAEQEGFYWQHAVRRSYVTEKCYVYTKFYGDRSVFRVTCTADGRPGELPGVYLSGKNGEGEAPLLILQKEEEIEGFWALDESLYCAVRKGEQLALRQYSLDGELLKEYPFDFAEDGYFMPCHEAVLYGRQGGEYYFVSHGMVNYPPEMDGAQIFELGDGKVLVIGAWVQNEASGVDLYLCEPGRLLFHGRIGTDVWKDWQYSQYTYGSEDYPTAEEPFRYFTMPEVVL